MSSQARQQLLARLQANVDALALPAERICPFSFHKAFLCRGFTQWLWDARARRREAGESMPPLAASEMRGLLASWDEVRRAGFAGDHCRGIQVDEYRLPCDGWDEYTDDDLARLCRDFGLPVDGGSAADS